MSLPNELKHWPHGWVLAILTDIESRQSADDRIEKSYRPEEHAVLTDLWRHDYIVLRDDLVLEQGETAQLDDLRLSTDGEELLEMLRSAHNPIERIESAVETTATIN